MGTFQMQNTYRSDDPMNEAWARIERFASRGILAKEFKAEINPANWESLILYISTRISQAIEFRNAMINQSLITKPLTLYYSMLNILRATIAIKYEVKSEIGHGLRFESSEVLLNSKAIIQRSGTFSQYLKTQNNKSLEGLTFSLRDVLGHIIEFGTDLRAFEEIPMHYFPFLVQCYTDGELEVIPQSESKKYQDCWETTFPMLKTDFSRTPEGRLICTREEFKEYGAVMTYVNKILLSDLNRISVNDYCIWFQYDDNEAMPRLAYYHIALFILSNIVRYEPESLQAIISENSEVYWLLKRLIYLTERYYAQLAISEIHGTPTYF